MYGNKTVTITSYEFISLCKAIYYKSVLALYTVYTKNGYKDFYFPVGDFIEERKAYEKAARYYNNLVPDGEEVPLF